MSKTTWVLLTVALLAINFMVWRMHKDIEETHLYLQKTEQDLKRIEQGLDRIKESATKAEELLKKSKSPPPTRFAPCRFFV